MNTDISLFADDSKISTVLSDVSERSTMQERLNQFMEWADRWQLKIAEHKCCVLTHGSDILPTYNLNGVQLLNVKEFRDLGIIVDADCLFKQHISHICRKAYCSINVIFRCFHTANIAALIISYKSFVRPMLEYCSTVWNPYIPARHYLGMTDQVEKVQRYFTRRVYQRCQLDCKHSYLQRLAYLEIESLELRRIYLDLVMVHKIVRGLITADLKRYFSFAIQAPNSAVRTRGHTFKLKTTRYRLNIAHNLFFNRVVSAWNGLPQHIVNLESSLSFKKALRTVSFHSLTTFDRHM